MSFDDPAADDAAPAQNPLHRLLEDARRKLVDTGARNRLVHVNRKSARAKVVNIVNERSDDIYRLLRAERKTMSFAALEPPETDGDTDERGVPRLTAFSGPVDEARYQDLCLETKLTPDGLQKRLLRLARDAATVESEQGVSVLYLALGFLVWFESETSDVERHAPLILLPVGLVRNGRTASFDLVSRDDDLTANLPLQERLRHDFGLELPEIEEDAGWSPGAYFAELEKRIAARPRWRIDRDGMQLGFFSFAKLLMLRDLDPEHWPAGGLDRHPIVANLLAGSFEAEPPLFERDERLDARLAPADIIQVIDADASQTKVIEEVRTGRNLVVQGPPGTGKSQTITNIIAAAVHDGKRVLFVAEKMAALSVVHDRLVKVGLKDPCLELHSRAANKRALLEELGRTMKSVGAVPNAAADASELLSARDKLNEICVALHAPIGDTDETPFEVMGAQSKFVGAGAPPPSVEIRGIDRISKAKAEDIATSLNDFARFSGKVGPKTAHPFRGVGALNLQPVELQRASDSAGILRDDFADFEKRLVAVAGQLGLKVAPTLRGAQTLIEALTFLRDAPTRDAAVLEAALRNAANPTIEEVCEFAAFYCDRRDEWALRFHPGALRSDTRALRQVLERASQSHLSRLGLARLVKGYRKASLHLAKVLAEPLPKTAKGRLERVEALEALQDATRDYEKERPHLKEIFGACLQENATFFYEALKTLRWARTSAANRSLKPKAAARLGSDETALTKRLNYFVTKRRSLSSAYEDVASKYNLNVGSLFLSADFASVALSDLYAHLDGLTTQWDRYEDWASLMRVERALRADGLSPLIAAVNASKMSAAEAITEFEYARPEALWSRALKENPALYEISSLSRHDLVADFQRLDRQSFRDTVSLIKSGHAATANGGDTKGAAIIRSEIAKKRSHRPIRKLIEGAGAAVQTMKPVFLMSPISVAQFLPPGAAEFDLLVIDEASQVRPEDALGAVARANQIVVVGDQKQLPPSAFFDRLTSNAEDEFDEDETLQGTARATEMESVLSLCEARGLPSRMLEWHYRSRDPSLISVSNAEFYNHNLILPPTPHQNDPAYGLRFSRVKGAYDRGGRRTNRIEAQAVVQRVVEHAAATPNVSLGIVTFSSTQRDVLTELLEVERRENSALDAFLRDGGSEDVFVKNIENVQGDERDVILVSVGYGPSEPGGRMMMDFGPVGREGGERRLNVLFTRARIRCEVFASFDPGDLDLSRVSKPGVRVLKRFLEYAKTGVLDDSNASGRDPDSPFEEDVAREIRAMGYEADPQVGSGGFLIDIGVRHPDRPGKYVLAVECDGATYHRALWARERDRLRQGVLENLGWKFHRIWSTDWFYRRKEELIRLRTALEAASSAIDEPDDPTDVEGVVFNSVMDDAEAREPLMLEAPEPHLVDADVSPRVTPYMRYERVRPLSGEPHEASMKALQSLVAEIVALEGPIHQDEVARRVASAFGKDRCGQRIHGVTKKALKAAGRTSATPLFCDDDFWHTTDQVENPTVRDRSAETAGVVKAAYLPPIEIDAALRAARAAAPLALENDVVREAARLMGFQRVGADLSAVFATRAAFVLGQSMTSNVA